MSEMSEGPNWKKALLGEVATCTLGGTPSTEIPLFWGGDIPWMASGDVHLRRIHDVPGRITKAGLTSSNATMTKPPAVAVGLAGQGKTRGTVALTLRELCTNQSIALLKGDQKDLLTEFLFHNLDRRYEELRARSSGGGRGGLSKGILEQVPMELPSLPVQSKIAEILDTLDTAIRENEAVVAKLKAIKQGLLYDLLTRGIDANGDLRPPQPEAPHLYKQTPLGWLPKGWDFSAMGDVSESIIDGPFGSNLKTGHYVETPGVRVVRLQNIQDGYFDDTEKVFILERHAAQLSRHEVVAGDVLIASLGDDGHPAGRACLYPDDLEPGINKADCFRFRGKSYCRNGYAMLFLNGTSARRQARGFQQGVTMKRMNLGNLRKVRIALPRPDEQERIEVRAAAINSAHDNALMELDKLRLQKSGLMDDLLTGRTHVTALL